MPAIDSNYSDVNKTAILKDASVATSGNPKENCERDDELVERFKCHFFVFTSIGASKKQQIK